MRIGVFRVFTTLFAILAGAALYGQYPATGNKSRLGWQTTGDGLVYRGTVSDTATIKPATVNNAYFLFDTLTSTLYRYIKTQNGWQPFTAAAGSVTLNGEVNGATNATTVDTVRRIWFDRTYTAPDTLGKLQWNADEGTLNLGVGFDGVTLQLGQETFYPNVINKTASLIKNGTVVMLDPVSPVQGDHIRVVPADGSGIYPSKLVMGIMTQDLPVDSLGLVTWFGYVREVKEADIVQTDITLAAGNVLYLSATQPGKVTNIEPTAPAIKVPIALVVRRPNPNNLTLLVRPWLNEDVSELNDVRIDSVVQNQVLRYDTAGGYWVASTSAGIVAADTAAMLLPYLKSSQIYAGTGISISRDSGVTISAITTLSVTQGGGMGDVAIVDDNNATPWDGNAIIVTPQALNPNQVTLTVNDQSVTFNVGAGTGNVDLAFSGTDSLVHLQSNGTTEVSFLQGENISITQGGNVMTIGAPLSLSASTTTTQNAVVVVDGNNATPWDGLNVIGYIGTQGSGITLTLNNESVTFYPVADGDKGDIVVSGNGEVWKVKNTSSTIRKNTAGNLNLQSGTNLAALEQYDKLYIWATVDSAQSDTVFLPSPAMDFQGKSVEVFVNYEVQNDGSIRISSSSNSIVIPTSAANLFYNSFAVNKLTYCKIVCIEDSSASYKWLIMTYDALD